ncbi:unnamed protein product [Brachionus calyciflorus]|uniref:Uncharacterized protein n=1 Tax=Brachionus calyciflorus TaxID=104777 RepID=A0A814P421_9BILA|nr:unnamed protein product [Brachionus calyciflorus]
MVKNCPKCQVNTDSTKYEPLNPTELPDGPWKLVSIDFYGPLKCGKHLMVLVCEYSRYPIVYVISSTSCTTMPPDPYYDPEPYKVIKIYGSMIIIERNGKVLHRNSSFLKAFLSSNEQATSKNKLIMNHRNILLFEDQESEVQASDKDLNKVSENVEEEFFDIIGASGETERKEDDELNETNENVDNSNEEEEKELEKINERPKRTSKKPDFFGNPIYHGPKPKHNPNYV